MEKVRPFLLPLALVLLLGPGVGGIALAALVLWRGPGWARRLLLTGAGAFAVAALAAAAIGNGLRAAGEPAASALAAGAIFLGGISAAAVAVGLMAYRQWRQARKGEPTAG